MDFFKFKLAIKEKIQAFIDKFEGAHQVQEKIEEFLKMKEEEKKKIKWDDKKIEEYREKVEQELEKWTAFDKQIIKIDVLPKNTPEFTYTRNNLHNVSLLQTPTKELKLIKSPLAYHNNSSINTTSTKEITPIKTANKFKSNRVPTSIRSVHKQSVTSSKVK
jgi:hypothetical protein